MNKKEVLSKFWYLAHPYTADTPEGIQANVDKANLIVARLAKAGLFVFSPVSMSHGPHLAGVKARLFAVNEWHMWMELDMKYCNMCHGIILVPGWVKSRGCKAEVRSFLAAHKELIPLSELYDILGIDTGIKTGFLVENSE